MHRFLIIVFLMIALVLVTTESQDIPSPSLDHYGMEEICAEKLNQQINKELEASLVYLHMAGHFRRNDVAKEGFAKFFDASSKEEAEHARKFIEYITKRGGSLKSFNVQMPTTNSWQTPLDAFNHAISLEKEVLASIHEVHLKAEHECKDAHLMDFLESEFMTEQVDSIDELTRLAAKLKSMEGSNGVGAYLMDREMLKRYEA
ncbi:soma ferritin-like isoform X1 [Brevipalpus obovatus]|uniref:soma ferritin-like isoform X1 n=1 Tax=Brevipalpus obovatus TaxID=246614 RepID=UPI003D9E2BD3